MWEIARVDMGMSEAEFGGTTLRRFAGYMDRLEDNRARKDLATGVVAMLLANIHRDRKTRPRPYGLSDVLPWLERILGDGRQSAEEIGNIVKHLAKVFGGKVYSLKEREAKDGAEGDR